MSTGLVKFVCSECGKTEDKMEMLHPGRDWKLLGLDIGKGEPIMICMHCHDTVGLGVVRYINGVTPPTKRTKVDRPLTELEAMASL